LPVTFSAEEEYVMRTVRNIIGVIFISTLLVAGGTNTLADVDCDAPQYNQVDTICYMTQDCTWDAAEPIHDFEYESPQCNWFHWGHFYFYLESNWGNSAEAHNFQCNDYCLGYPPPYGCGTYGSFQVYDFFVGTCPS
jgi:hypothetical protein